MYKRLIIIMGSLLLSVTLIAAQAEQCTNAIQTALSTAEQACDGLERNQACFGNISLQATSQPDVSSFQFTNVGDVVDVAAIQSIQLAGYDSETGAWGVVLMQLQANLPSTLPGQNVTVLLFGDTTLRNAANSVDAQIPPEQQQTITASGAVNVRALPTTTATVLGSLNAGEDVTATGRTEDNEWIRIRYQDRTGWVAAFLLSGDADINTLLAVTPESNQLGPMQAFYLTTGIGRPACNDVPEDGMLIQTPEGAGTINLLVNEVEVDMGSTVYFRVTDEQQLSIAPVEGAARVNLNGQSQTAIAGTQIEIQLDDDFTASDDDIELDSYLGDEDIAMLPIDILERDIEIELGLEEEDFELFENYDEIFENIDLEDTDELFDYLDDAEDLDDLDLPAYLIDELGYSDFDDELEIYFEEAGYDLDEYDEYIGDDYYDDEYEYDDSYEYDEYGDDYSDSYDYDNYDEYGDSYDYDDGGYDDGDSYDDSGGYDDDYDGYDGYDD